MLKICIWKIFYIQNVYVQKVLFPLCIMYNVCKFKRCKFIYEKSLYHIFCRSFYICRSFSAPITIQSIHLFRAVSLPRQKYDINEQRRDRKWIFQIQGVNHFKPISCEINFEDSRSANAAVFAFLRTVNFVQLVNFSHKKVQEFIKIKIKSL